MKKVLKSALRILAVLLLLPLTLIALLTIIVFIWDNIALQTEKNKIEPVGTFVEVDGYNMNVYTEGEKNDKPVIVFLDGLGGHSPIYSFKPLYSQLSDEYRIAVIEKFGYGYADNPDMERSVQTVVRQNREALQKAGIEAPYILAPFSYSGYEAIYWAQEYPDEITAVIGLDCGVTAEAEPKFSGAAVAALKFVDFLDVFMMDAGYQRILYGTNPVNELVEIYLTESEITQYKYLLFRTCHRAKKITKRETDSQDENISVIDARGVPDVPMLIFVPIEYQVEDYAGYKEWRDSRLDYAKKSDKIEIQEPVGTHFFFLERPIQTVESIRAYLSELLKE